MEAAVRTAASAGRRAEAAGKLKTVVERRAGRQTGRRVETQTGRTAEAAGRMEAVVQEKVEMLPGIVVGVV